MSAKEEGVGTLLRAELRSKPIAAVENSTVGSRLRFAKSSTRSFIADTLALFIFFTVTGIINERYVVGMTWEQVLQARLIGTAIMIPSGRPYGMWRDFMMRRARANAFSHWSWDSIALLSFQTPIYASIIFLSGATGLALILGTATAALMMICLGRPYGMFLLLIRRAFRVETTVGAVASS